MAPTKDAPIEQRVAAYEDLAPNAVMETTSITVTRGITTAQTWTDHLMLKGGLRIYHPEDLLPVVDPSSPTAGYVQEYLLMSSRATTASYVSLGAMGVGGASLLASLPFGSGTVEGQTAYWVAAAAGAVMIAGYVGATVFWFRAGEERTGAFLSYDRSLQQRLGLHDVPTRPNVAPEESGGTRPEVIRIRYAP